MILEHNGLRLLPANTDFAGQLSAFYSKNRAFLKSFETERDELFYTSVYQQKVLEQEMKAQKNREAYRFYVKLSERPDTIIGVIGLNNIVWKSFCSAFLGYKLDADHTNAGYMTTAVCLITGYAFTRLHLHRIEANVMPKNTASLRVLEKNNFINEGISKYYLKINGVWEDHIHMVKINYTMHS